MVRLIPCSIALLSLVGCGGQPSLSGAITLNGEPLRASSEVGGTVVFSPVGGGSAPATASIDSEGRYEVSMGSQRGLPPGEYAVTVSAIRALPASAKGNGLGLERLLPYKYDSPKTSGLAVKVEPGSNTFDIALNSAPKK